jgi:hypothetical protein
MYGDEKPKRKREESGNSLDFVTALTVEQCVERLERGPAHTLDHRLTVRTDGQRFVVEAWGEISRRPRTIARLEGRLSQGANDSTRVFGMVTNNNPYDNWGMIAIPVIIVLWWGMLNLIGLGGVGVTVFNLVIIVGYVGILASLSDKFDQQTPDLRRWVRDQLYVPPEQKA